MSSLIIRDAVSGAPRTIEEPLLPEHVQVGRVLWYDGFTSTGRWDCPAIVTQVDEKKKKFRVRSLDDMREQDQWYGFSSENDTTHSRSTMRLPNAEEVDEYLKQQRAALEANVARTNSQHCSAVGALKYFDEVRASITF